MKNKRHHKKDNDNYRHLRSVDPSQISGNSISITEYKALRSNSTKKVPSKNSNTQTTSNPPAKNKFGAQKSEVDGIIFDSKIEAYRYMMLKDMQRNGVISKLEIQVKFEIIINDIKICDYIADFCYQCHQTNQYVVEDVKGKKHPVYQLKKKMMKACHDISIKEVTKENLTE